MYLRGDRITPRMALAAMGLGAPLVFVATGDDPGLAYLGVAALIALTFALAGPVAPLTPAVGTHGRFTPRPMILGFGAIAIGTEACLIGLGPTALIAQGQTEVGAAGGIAAPVILSAVMAVAGDAMFFCVVPGAAGLVGLAVRPRMVMV